MVLVTFVVMAVVVLPATAMAQTPGGPAPVATAPTVVGSGDSRSDGEGPGLVGSPVAIAVGVIVLGVLTALGTVVVVRLGSRGGR